MSARNSARVSAISKAYSRLNTALTFENFVSHITCIVHIIYHIYILHLVALTDCRRRKHRRGCASAIVDPILAPWCKLRHHTPTVTHLFAAGQIAINTRDLTQHLRCTRGLVAVCRHAGCGDDVGQPCLYFVFNCCLVGNAQTLRLHFRCLGGSGGGAHVGCVVAASQTETSMTLLLSQSLSLSRSLSRSLSLS